MAQHTRQPQVLRELFEALGNDPFVIAECLARPVLAERLLTQSDREEIKQVSLTYEQVVAATGNYRLPSIAYDGGCTDHTWTATSHGERTISPIWTYGSLDRKRNDRLGRQQFFKHRRQIQSEHRQLGSYKYC